MVQTNPCAKKQIAEECHTNLSQGRPGVVDVPLVHLAASAVLRESLLPVRGFAVSRRVQGANLSQARRFVRFLGLDCSLRQNHRSGELHLLFGAGRGRRSGELQFLLDGKVELYNTRTDLSESKNLVRSHPKKKKELLDQLQTWRATNNAPVPASAIVK